MVSMNKNTLTLIVLLQVCFLNSFILISPVSAEEDSWTTLTPMPTARSGLGVAVVEGKIYAIGGKNGSYLSVNEMYDPGTDTWTAKQPMPTARSFFGIAVVQNKIYVIGGIIGPNGPSSNGFTGVNEVYDPSNDTWETLEPMPTPRAFLPANVVEDKIYLIGGSKYLYYSPAFYQSSLVNEVYDPETDTWETKAPLLSANSHRPSAVVDNKIYLFISTQIYDPETDSWTRGEEEIPYGSYDALESVAGATTGMLAPKRIYVFGGLNQYNVPANFTQIYDPETDSWTAGTPMPTPRWALAVAVVNDELYAIGGYNGTARFAVNERYTPSGYIPEFPSWIFMPLLVTATVVAVILKKRLASSYSDV